MEREIEILENLKEYLQQKIDIGEHKIIYNDLLHDEKTVDCINAIESLIKGYKYLSKENEAIMAINREVGNRINELTDELHKIYPPLHSAE